MSPSYAVVVPWHNPKQLQAFLDAWQVKSPTDFLILQQDKNKEGCARTKNKGIRRAFETGASTICVLDDDCYPSASCKTLVEFARQHEEALRAQKIELFANTTYPAARGTPYFERTVEMAVAASMGFWENIPDLDAVSALSYGPNAPVQFSQSIFYAKYFPLCGMNFAFNRHWIECAQLIDIPRFDDIWMGWIWQKVAYDHEYCFNLKGPVVTHSRQSNLWKNLQEEAKYLELNETLWRTIYRQYKDATPAYLRSVVLHEITDFESRHRVIETGSGASGKAGCTGTVGLCCPGARGVPGRDYSHKTNPAIRPYLDTTDRWA